MKIRGEEVKTFQNLNRARASLIKKDECASPAAFLGLSWQSTLPAEIFSTTNRRHSTTLEGVEGLVCVADEGQAHLSLLGIWHSPSLSTMNGASVLLRNLVDREVRHVNVRAESGLKGRANAAQLVPHNTSEEWVVLDLGRTTMLTTLATDTVLRVTQEAKSIVSIQISQLQI